MKAVRDATYWAEQVRSGEISAAELLDYTLMKIEHLNPQYNAVIAHDILQAKQDLPKTRQGFFAGVPFPLKMLGQSHAGLPATASSRLFENDVATRDSYYVTKLMEAGFTPFGQTNAPEFGFKNITDSALYGDTRNVWNLAHYSGGSSGGAASAVAAGMFPIAGASDGGGSIRIPASFSGLIGLKMTRGRMPQGPDGFRSWQGASIAGALTVSVRDTARFVAEMQVVQEAAPYQAPLLDKERLLTISEPKKRLDIAFSLEAPIAGIEISDDAKNAVLNAVAFLKSQGHHVYEVPFPLDARYLIESYYQMNAAETAAMLLPWERMAGQKLTSDAVELLTYALLETGRKTPVASYIDALDEWDDVAAIFEKNIFEDYDAFLTPTTAKTAPKIGEELMSSEVLEKMGNIADKSFAEQLEIIEEAFERSLAYSPYTFISNLTGQPAISLPVYVSDTTNLPMGIQFWGRKNSEIELLEIAKEFENHGQFRLPDYYC
ncbi:amidase family protein [Lactococcus nasutitermitis]|uniref:Amidase family protein n=1 Tax=Lactococcus nasutitermitis TaxID=1652957 RepID=A0ABV9JE18_9LACT|nr:amidase family protein [Lactococcus nasutitermitis]